MIKLSPHLTEFNTLRQPFSDIASFAQATSLLPASENERPVMWIEILKICTWASYSIIPVIETIYSYGSTGSRDRSPLVRHPALCDISVERFELNRPPDDLTRVFQSKQAPIASQ